MIEKIKNLRKKYIFELLIELKNREEAFNKMIGSLYSNICADEINEIIWELEKFDVKVDYYQYKPGRVTFTNLEKLLEKYKD